MKPFTRADRVGGQIRQALSDLLLKDISDPRLEGVAISGVKVAADLKSARVYFITLGSKRSSEDTTAGFNSALGYVKRSLAKRLGLRYMPDLKFFPDDSFEYGTRIDKILKSLNTDDGSNHSTTEK